MSEIRTILIVGASLTGAKAAEALRKDGYDGRIVLFGKEPQPPYLRPPLSKEYLRGEGELDKVFVHPEAWYAEQRIELHLWTPVRAIEPATREVVLDDGRRVAFDRLLIATGAAPRRLNIPGSDLAGVHYLRTLEDANAIRDAVTTARRAIVIGGGWIGAEVAASLRQLGLPVTLVAPRSVVDARSRPPNAAVPGGIIAPSAIASQPSSGSHRAAPSVQTQNERRFTMSPLAGIPCASAICSRRYLRVIETSRSGFAFGHTASSVQSSPSSRAHT